MKSVDVSRKIKFRVTYDETKPEAKKEAMREVREIMSSRSWPIPFAVRAAGYEIERIW